jgi:hypothetical protein
VRLDGRPLTACHPFIVKLDFGVDQGQSVCPSSDSFFHTSAVSGEQCATLLQSRIANFDEGCVLAHLRYRHTRETKSFHKVQPANMVFGVDTPAAAVPGYAWNQPLRLVPANRVDAASCPVGDSSDPQCLCHANLASSVISHSIPVDASSRSGCTLHSVYRNLPQWTEWIIFQLGVTGAQIAGGYHRVLNSLQGRNNTFYNSATFQTNDSSLIWQFTEGLLPQIVS